MGKSILITIILLNSIYPQNKNIKTIDWLSFGLGVGENSKCSSFISYTLAEENLNLNFQFNDYRHISLFGASNKSISSYSIAYGLTQHSSFGFGGIFAGPALVINRLNLDKTKYSPGLHLGAQYNFTCLDEMGLGIDTFANLNFEQVMFGFRIGLFFRALI